MDDNFRERFGFSERSLHFKNHQELDIFVNKLEIKDMHFQKHYPEEYMLLKAFDRAFWLRLFRARSDLMKAKKDNEYEQILTLFPKYAPLRKSGRNDDVDQNDLRDKHAKCPFQSPYSK
jgi:hypothetical protein